MKPVKSIYIKLLIIAVAAWIISVTFFIADIYHKVGEIEHNLVHAKCPTHPH